MKGSVLFIFGVILLAGLNISPLAASASDSGSGDDQDMSFAGLVGASSWSTSGTTAKSFAAGLRWDVLPLPIWSLGIEWTISPNLPEGTSTVNTYNLMTATAETDYRIETEDGLTFFLGPKIGAGIGAVSKRRGGNFAGGVEGGMDLRIIPRLSVGAMLEVLYVGAMTVNQVPLNSGVLFQGFGTVKVWF